MKLQALLILIVVAVNLPWSAGAYTREELVCLVREDWEAWPDGCPCKEGWKPTEEEIQGILEAHETWLENEGWRDPAVPGQAILCNADLSNVKLEGAFLALAHLENANLSKANLSKANLASANLLEANLSATSLREAILWSANLRGAILGGTNLEAAQLSGAVLAQSLYLPFSQPAGGPHLAAITGLASIVVPYDEKSSETQVTAMVQFRKLFREAGLREQGRQATFAIEHHKALHAREHGTHIRRLGGWLQLVFFEWTTSWGLYPSRALAIALVVMVVLGLVVYPAPIAAAPSHASPKHGIFQVWTAEEYGAPQGRVSAADEVEIKRLSGNVPKAFLWGMWFSVLSAFHIGWRDLNVGTWLSRIQPFPFALRARGWVRMVSGFQSLISVYLVAMWVLTYFGRPFQ